MSLNPQVKSNLRQRIRFFVFFTLLLFLIIFLRLIYLQLFLGSELKAKSAENLERYSYISAPRGKIFDRSGMLLADTVPVYNLELLSDRKSEADSVLEFTAKLFKEDLQALKDNYKNNNLYRYSYQNLIIYERLSDKQLSKLATRLYKYPYLSIAVQPEREYLTPEINSHLLGYVREISGEKLKEYSKNEYLPGDKIGKNGLEKTFEKHLKGDKGVKLITVKASGYKLSEKIIKQAEKGQDLYLSVDQRLQRSASEALGENSGVVVALDPGSGEILTFVSQPGYDIREFAGRLSPTTWKKLLNDPKKPLTNRIINGKYPPGSIFKAFTAYAGLEQGIITQEDKVLCNGVYLMNNRTRFHCHKRSGHGHVNLAEALMGSCNVYFYRLGVELGIDQIYNYSKKFGLGSKTGINLPDESNGLVPSRAWKKQAFRNKEDQVWYPGETPSVAIGQGALSITPLQIVTAFSALVSNGILWQPTVVKGDEKSTRVRDKLNLNKEFQEQVNHGLFAVVNAERGTARRARLKQEDILVLGKTATAQIKSSKNLKGLDSENHAMFVGAAPYDNPQIAIFVLVEHGGGGGAAAAPVAKVVLDKFFELKAKNEI